MFAARRRSRRSSIAVRRTGESKRYSGISAIVCGTRMLKTGWLDSSPKDIRDNIEVFAGDIRDPYGVKEAMKGCDVVLHLAALIAIPYSYHSPDTYKIPGINDIPEDFRVELLRNDKKTFKMNFISLKNIKIS